MQKKLPMDHVAFRFCIFSNFDRADEKSISNAYKTTRTIRMGLNT